MRKHRFFLTEELNPGQTITLPHELYHHISRVLRLQHGAEIYLFNNTGYEFLATVNNKDVTIVEQFADDRESPLKINLAQVIGKSDKMDWVIQKATELGVHSITPLFSQHSIGSKTKKLPHWQKIAVAASCQSWRNYVPIINPPQDLAAWAKDNNDPVKVILAPGGAKISTLNSLTQVSILVGPEGGFSNEELQMTNQLHFHNIGLGPRILRTETAGIAAIAILQTLAGDM